jgi:hypothetical protein
MQKKVPVVPFFHQKFAELGDTTYKDSINYVYSAVNLIKHALQHCTESMSARAEGQWTKKHSSMRYTEMQKSFFSHEKICDPQILMAIDRTDRKRGCRTIGHSQSQQVSKYDM